MNNEPGTAETPLQDRIVIEISRSNLNRSLLNRLPPTQRSFRLGVNFGPLGATQTVDTVNQVITDLSKEEISRRAAAAGISINPNLPKNVFDVLCQEKLSYYLAGKTTKETARQARIVGQAGEMGASYLRLHMEQGPQRMDLLLKPDGTISPEGLTNLTFLLGLAKSNTVEICLGPNLPRYEIPGQLPIENGTPFKLPETDVEMKIFQQYTELVYALAPDCPLTLWVEPNFNLADNGIAENAEGGRFNIEGRSPEKYGRLFLQIAKNLYATWGKMRVVVGEKDGKTVYYPPQPKLGMDVAFVDTDFLVKALSVSDSTGNRAADYCSYVSIHPYRENGDNRPEQPGPFWDPNQPSKTYGREGCFDFRPNPHFSTYEEEVLDLYQKIGQINPNIRVISGEWGWKLSGSRDAKQQAAYLFRGLVLNKILGLPTAVWQLDGQYDEEYGLLDPEGKPKPAYYAARNFSQILASESIEPLGSLPSPDPTVRVETFADKKRGWAIIVMWSTDNQQKPIELQLTPNSAALLRDKAYLLLADAHDLQPDSIIELPVTNNTIKAIVDETPKILYIPSTKT